MQVHVERIAGEPVVEHDLAADEGLEGQGGEHVETEAEPGNVHHDVVTREVVEDVTFGERAEGEEAGEGHGEAGYHGDGGAEVCHPGETVHGRGL